VSDSVKNQDATTQEPMEEKQQSLAEDKRLDRLLKTVIAEVKIYAEDQIKHMRQLAQIGIALSGEKDIKKLLESIVDEARDLSNADAGTLYIMDQKERSLRFEILQNASMKTRMGGTSGVEIPFPEVPLFKDGAPNLSNVSSYVALKDETVNIPDVYEAEGFDFTGPRNYDATTGYRSKSMLVIPMKNHENDIIGVLQLLNAQEPDTDEVIPFSSEYVDLAASLASQAAVALTNAQLIQDLTDLFNAFIRSIATAIDEKSPYTGGHINRVVDLTMMIAEKINHTNEKPFKDLSFDDEELQALRMAAWMHDVGKITTPEHVVDKATKLETIQDGLNLIEIRFGLIAKVIENEQLRREVDLWQKGDIHAGDSAKGEADIAEELKALTEDLEFIRDCNTPAEFMSDEKIERLETIGRKSYVVDGEEHTYLTPEEVQKLSIKKGTLTAKERAVIENHTTMTAKMLQKLPFPKLLAKVPDYAAAHHEKLDGTGYPQRLSKAEISVQARIMAIADIFEALTAPDRPYKKPMKLSQAIKIMGFMKNDHHIDPDIYDLFIQSGLPQEYAHKEMNPDQIDEIVPG